jgi:hypothetical protein
VRVWSYGVTRSDSQGNFFPDAGSAKRAAEPNAGECSNTEPWMVPFRPECSTQ